MNVQIDVKSLEQGAYAAVMAGGTRALRELLATAEKVGPSATIPAKRGRKPKAADKPAKSSKRTKADKPGTPTGKRERRSDEEVEATCGKVLSALRGGPLGMEKLVTATGLDRKILMLPVRKLVTSGKISQAGTKRSTTYAIAA